MVANFIINRRGGKLYFFLGICNCYIAYRDIVILRLIHFRQEKRKFLILFLFWNFVVETKQSNEAGFKVIAFVSIFFIYPLFDVQI